MPFSYKIVPSLDLLIVVARGIITDQEVLALYAAFSSDPQFSPEIRALSDYTNVVENRVTMELIKELASMSHFSSKSRRAVVLTRDSERERAETYRSYLSLKGNESPSFRAFSSRKLAMEWLDLGEEALKIVDAFVDSQQVQSS